MQMLFSKRRFKRAAAQGELASCSPNLNLSSLAQVVGGKNNVLAKAAARGELATSAALLPAARCDLQALQLLASLDPLALCEGELSCGGVLLRKGF